VDESLPRKKRLPHEKRRSHKGNFKVNYRSWEGGSCSWAIIWGATSRGKKAFLKKKDPKRKGHKQLQIPSKEEVRGG